MTLRRLLRVLGRRRAAADLAAENAAAVARASHRLLRVLAIERHADQVPAGEWFLTQWSRALAVRDLEALGLGDRVALYTAASRGL